jgi:hypothetical protein
MVRMARVLMMIEEREKESESLAPRTSSHIKERLKSVGKVSCRDCGMHKAPRQHTCM